MLRWLPVNLYLVGYRCTGKSMVGRLLSEALAWILVDMDQQLGAEAGMPIQDVVSTKGWKHFREQEARLLLRLSKTVRQVIATGGGVVTTAANITAMRTSGKVVWLRAGPSIIAERMLADSNTVSQRPPLRGEDALAEIEEILRERMPLYEQAMHFQVDTDGWSPQEVADRIRDWLKTFEVEI